MLVVRKGVRTGSDQRHLSTEDIRQLGQVVEARPPERGADPCHTWVRAPCLGHIWIFVQTIMHRAKLQNFELVIVKSQTSLAEQCRPRAANRDNNPDGQH